MSDESKRLNVFDAAGIAAAGFGNYGWWKCMACGGFAGFESAPAASAVMPWCRNPECSSRSAGCVKTFDPLPESIQREFRS